MLDIKILEKSSYFHKRTLERGEYLFKQGDFDENIYIILIGNILVLKNGKIIAQLKQNEIFGESSLNDNKAKLVDIKAKHKTILLYIKAKDINKYAITNNKEAFNLLKYIIYLSNKRLNKSNELITANALFSEEIIKLKDFSYKTIFSLIDKIKEITKFSKEIIYIEVNPVLKHYITIKYQTTNKSIINNKIYKIIDNKIDLIELKINERYNYIQDIQIGDEIYGYLIFIKNNSEFSDNEKKVIITISSSFAGVLKQKQILKEQKNLEYMKNY